MESLPNKYSSKPSVISVQGGLAHQLDTIAMQQVAIDDLQKNQAYLEGIIDTIRESLLILDGDLRVQLANRSFYHEFHVLPEETENKLLYDLGNGQWNIPQLRTLLEDILPLNTYFNDFTVEHHFPDIGPKVMLLNARRIRQEDGKVDRILLAIEDITERHRLEREATELLESEQKARAEAEKANRIKDDFLATVSHELRTPLTSILGWTRLMLSGQLDEEAQHRALETIDRNVQSQAQLIEDLLDVSRIISGNLRLDIQSVDLPTVIAKAIEIIRPTAEIKNIRIQIMFDSGDNVIYGDPERMQQILWNLISNAVKFTPKGGRIQVRLEHVNSNIEIVVQDSGQGISADFLPYVFDRFRQSDSSTRRKSGGLGLGLAIVRHLAELHGGSVSVDSEGEGKGSTFTVRLPRRAANVNPYMLKPDVKQKHTRMANEYSTFDIAPVLEGLRLLVVEDEPDSREVIAMLLRQAGAEVTACASVAKALQTLPEQLPDVIISDIGMPEQDGYQLIEQVRALAPEAGGQIPAIALTAYARVEDRVRALSAGFQLFVPKPVEPGELVAAVASLAKLRR
jgi:two-component system CheB/CheR fusion protein